VRFLSVSAGGKRLLMKDWPSEASPEVGAVRRWLGRSYRVGMMLAGGRVAGLVEIG
jgi:hypothetical protein